MNEIILLRSMFPCPFLKQNHASETNELKTVWLFWKWNCSYWKFCKLLLCSYQRGEVKGMFNVHVSCIKALWKHEKGLMCSKELLKLVRSPARTRYTNTKSRNRELFSNAHPHWLQWELIVQISTKSFKKSVCSFSLSISFPLTWKFPRW